jgi:hypothetical protein
VTNSKIAGTCKNKHKKLFTRQINSDILSNEKPGKRFPVLGVCLYIKKTIYWKSGKRFPNTG